MPAGGPVSVRRQCVYAAIPILDIYSAYHIKKLRWYLLVMLCSVLIQTAIEFALFDDMIEIPEAYTAFLDPESERFAQSVYVVLWTAGNIAGSVVLIRWWSMRWNAGMSWNHRA